MDIEVKLLHVTPLEIAVNAIRQCYESQDKSDSCYKIIDLYVKDTDVVYKTKEEYVLGEKDKALIETITKCEHGSTLEHISFNFQIKGISRLNLQELARHRMASLSVKSTRYTLKMLKGEGEFNHLDPEDWNRAEKYLNFIGIPDIDTCSMIALDNLRSLIQSGYTNDQAKYALPECFKTDLYYTINLRSLRNLLKLRLSNRAHFEIRELSQKIKDTIPDEYQFMLDNL